MGRYTKYQGSPLGNGVLRWDGKICYIYDIHLTVHWTAGSIHIRISWWVVWARYLSISLSSTTKASGLKQLGSLEILSKYQGSLVCPCTARNIWTAPLMTVSLYHRYAPDRFRLFIRNIFFHRCLCFNIRGAFQPRRYHRLMRFQKIPLVKDSKVRLRTINKVNYPEVFQRRYIVAQILGAFIACLFVYNQWKVLIDESEALLMAAGPAEFAANQFTPNGLPGIFVPYLLPEQTLSRAFMNEFVNVRLECYRKLPFISKYFIWTIVCHHRPDHLVSTGPNKLLRPTGNDTIRHFFCIVSHHSNHLNEISYDIVSISIVASPFGVLVFQDVSLIVFAWSYSSCTHLFGVFSCIELSSWYGSPSYGNNHLGSAR